MIRFALNEMLDEQACYNYLLAALHPYGLHCPLGHSLPNGQAPHRWLRAPVMDYRCRRCGRVFNAFSGTIWSKSKYRPSMIVQILKGIAQGTPTQHLAFELKIDRSTLTGRRQKIQGLLAGNFPFLPPKLKDEISEADEMYQNAVEKGLARFCQFRIRGKLNVRIPS